MCWSKKIIFFIYFFYKKYFASCIWKAIFFVYCVSFRMLVTFAVATRLLKDHKANFQELGWVLSLYQSSMFTLIRKRSIQHRNNLLPRHNIGKLIIYLWIILCVIYLSFPLVFCYYFICRKFIAYYFMCTVQHVVLLYFCHCIVFALRCSQFELNNSGKYFEQMLVCSYNLCKVSEIQDIMSKIMKVEGKKVEFKFLSLDRQIFHVQM